MQQKQINRITLKIGCQSRYPKRRKPFWYIVAISHFQFIESEGELPKHPLDGRSWAPYATRNAAHEFALEVIKNHANKEVPISIEE